ncbi:hypothetical protein [Streptomyces chilikensis]|uniref:Uncharacterized protein n=1 Tax=Streptomyces chilikensis TaxID=1194079 RepID=A0ABV3ERD4_9ACTN
MTVSSHTTAQSAPAADTGEETLMADLVLGGRAMATSQHLAGIIALAQLDTAGRPGKLPHDLFPGVDPEVVQMVWERAFTVGFRAAQFAGAPRYNRDKLERLRGELEAAGFTAMAGLSRRVVTEDQEIPPAPHPRDEEEAREHREWL